ncbi:MAG: glycosyltransferase family 4 protein [Pseudomonadales bacterium]|nr:glycosyltransferase family 4 protein [Pseudomonadales bacterium]MBO6565062.1 glycosyltransferase family 4 protein [Pseudomonadales bacterium]MBO6594315.1 glycosyltransferase family 4 protein [Pseudomonadales bacterium]MBO6700816.1 glycosyltransferase family 4 protein [Pseudomonadales bacterium]MBO6822124.1 glycosyltransferase family 4 protein [Pseudomonadales bacterium]
MLAADQRPPQFQVIDQPKLKICLLGYRSNPYSGGQGIYLKFLSKALVERGHRVDVISGEPYPELDERVRLIKLPGLNLFEAENHVTALRPHHLTSYTDFIEWWSMLTGGFAEPYTFGRRLVDYFKRHQPDYDIVHDNQSLCYGTLQLQKMGVPLLTTIHHPITSDLRIALQSAENWKMRLLIRRWHSFLRMQKKVVRQLKNLVTVSEASRFDIATDFSVPEDTLKIVHNGIDTEVFRPIPDILREPYTIMATASADAPLKGLDYLIHAIAQLRNEIPDLKLNVLGKLKEDGDTAKLIKRLNIGDRITFHSGLTSEEVAELYARATCAVVPSIYEGFGLPAGEAMACGVPIISTDGGALPEVVGDAGITVPTRDAGAIASSIRVMMDDADLRERLAGRGRKRILEKFSWAVAAEQMEKLYRKIIVEKVS